ncbi:hypothetical protein LLS1_27810 [Leifsonia sp. LS1]|nr:hypothetical protein LLS1_27810 [Leifsonia sp. LS1]
MLPLSSTSTSARVAPGTTVTQPYKALSDAILSAGTLDHAQVSTPALASAYAAGTRDASNSTGWTAIRKAPATTSVGTN